MHRLLFTILGIPILVLFIQVEARACTCSLPRTSDLNQRVKPIHQDSKAVFLGKVVEIINEPSVTMKFKVDQFWKEQIDETLLLNTGGGGGDCAYNFKVGKNSLVYAYGSDDSILSTSICQRTAELSEAKSDLAFLGKGTVPPLSKFQVASPIREYRQANEHRLLSEFVQLLSIPNVASDTVNIRKNADYLVAGMQKRGLKPRLLEAADKKVPPVVYGEWMTPGATKTVIFYAHYDGQPTDPAAWSGSKPWEPVLRSTSLEKGGKTIPFPALSEKIDPEWRIYGRSASDDKAGVFAILTAFDALIAKGIKPTVNIKFFFEGEEEAGSANLKEILTRNKDLLQADAFIVCDGPVHQSGRKQVVFGVRGDVNVDLTVYGAKRPLHSGHYGNWSPNPAMMLAKLLSSMKDDKGNTIVKAWTDDVEPLGAVEIQAIKDAPQSDEQIKRELGIVNSEGGGKSLLELINQPSLNINGFKSGDVGEQARNVIPISAATVLDLRLVKGNNVERQVGKLRKHIESQGYYVIDREPTDEERLKYPTIAKFTARAGGYNAQRTKMDLPISLAVVEAVKSTTDQPIVQMPTLGGSLPLSIITENLDGIPTITVPIANHDNNQHAENENIRIQNLWDGIETFASLMTMKF
jgi:acetylornithine deacetylase/succinyl-diaminopimelate desuccinylase-like protein